MNQKLFYYVHSPIKSSPIYSHQYKRIHKYLALRKFGRRFTKLGSFLRSLTAIDAVAALAVMYCWFAYFPR